MSSGGRSLIRLVTMGVGLGMAGMGVYGNQISDPRLNTVQAFVQDNARTLIILGVALVVVGGILNFVLMQRMQKRMMSSMMGNMGGMGAMGGGRNPDSMQGMPPGLASMMGRPAEVVKVRCPSCSKLQAETATFCSDCGKPLIPAPAR